MKTYLDCYPCFMRQALQASRFAGIDEAGQKRILLSVMSSLESMPDGASPPTMAREIHRLVREIGGNPDPYRTAKVRSTEHALTWYPVLRDRIDAANDPLDMAIRLSIAGNIIDLGASVDYDLEDSIDRVLSQPLAIDDMSDLRRRLEKVSRVLYLGDNSGESVFDRLLIETLDVPVTYVVRGAPTINDVTYQEAVEAGLDTIAEIIDNGSDAPGTLLDTTSPDFREHFDSAELILAKGQGNFESLSHVDAPIVFLLQAKCSVIAGELGIAEKGLVVKAPRNGRR
ncbi:MAG: damage-control phosphatase ARMT1 family protein [Pseudomonadota bacterium]